MSELTSYTENGFEIPNLIPANEVDADGDELIFTEAGMQKAKLFVKSEGRDETDSEIIFWVAYHTAEGVMVHRSAHVHLKKAPVWGAGIAAAIG